MDAMQIIKGIKHLRPEAEFSFEGDDYSNIKWNVLEGEAPTLKEVEAAAKEVENAELEAQAQKNASKAVLLQKLGITEDEVRLLLA